MTISQFALNRRNRVLFFCVTCFYSAQLLWIYILLARTNSFLLKNFFKFIFYYFLLIVLFLLLSNIPLCDVPHFVYVSVNNLVCFYKQLLWTFLTTLLLYWHLFLFFIFLSGIGLSNFLRNGQTVFQSDCTALHFHQQCDTFSSCTFKPVWENTGWWKWLWL